LKHWNRLKQIESSHGCGPMVFLIYRSIPSFAPWPLSTLFGNLALPMIQGVSRGRMHNLLEKSMKNDLLMKNIIDANYANRLVSNRC
jgi:hypothetical protein